MLDDRDGVSYPEGFESPDGTIYVSYVHNRSTDGEILFARFTEEDILAKRIVGTKSTLKTLISRPLKPKVDAHALAKPAAAPAPTAKAKLSN